jgi:hypothetical protein
LMSFQNHCEWVCLCNLFCSKWRPLKPDADVDVARVCTTNTLVQNVRCVLHMQIKCIDTQIKTDTSQVLRFGVLHGAVCVAYANQVHRYANQDRHVAGAPLWGSYTRQCVLHMQIKCIDTRIKTDTSQVLHFGGLTRGSVGPVAFAGLLFIIR